MRDNDEDLDLGAPDGPDEGLVAEPVFATADVSQVRIPEPPAEKAEPVRARWVHPEPVFNAELGIIQYGDELLVSPEQLEDPNTPAIAWDDNWTPDPDVAALVPDAPSFDPEEG